MKKQLLLSALAFTFFQHTSNAQLSLVEDLNPGTEDALPEYERQTFAFNGAILLAATDGAAGNELYSLKDGVLSLIKDINPGAASSDPTSFVLYNDKVYFTAKTEDDGYEIWSTDGTEGGTQLAIETAPGTSTSLGPGVCVMIPARNGKLYFNAMGYVFESDGTTASTEPINGGQNNVSFYPDYSIVSPKVTKYGQGIAFYATDGNDRMIYSYDGTLHLHATLSLAFFTDVYGLSEVSGGLLYAVHDSFDDDLNGLFVIDTDNNTTTELLNGAGESFEVNRVLHFTAEKAVFKGLTGGIYATDGTQAGTVKIADATYTLYQGELIPHAVVGDKIFFYGDEDFFDEKMYVSDGTVAGTSLAGTGTSPFLTNVIVKDNFAYWGCGVSNNFNTKIYQTNLNTLTTTEIYEFTENSTTDDSYLIGAEDDKVYIGSSLKGDGREVYQLALTPTNVFSGVTNTTGYSLSTLGGSTYAVSSDQSEILTVAQYDLNGRLLSTHQTEQGVGFRVVSNQGLSLLKVSGKKGIVTYRLLN